MVTRSLCLLFLLALSASAQTPRIPPPEAVNRNGLLSRLSWVGGVKADGFISGLDPGSMVNWLRGGINGGSQNTRQTVLSGRRVWSVLNGASYISFGHFPPGGAMTIMAWVRIDPNDNGGTVVSAGFDSPRAGWGLQLIAETNAVFAAIVKTDGGVAQITGASVPWPGGDRHLAVVWRSGSGFPTYLDGELFAANPTSATTLRYDNGTWVGASKYGSPTFTGYVADIRIYNRALSADEIKRIYRGLE
jgi:hypothetical protein